MVSADKENEEEGAIDGVDNSLESILAKLVIESNSTIIPTILVTHAAGDQVGVLTVDD